MGIGDSMKEKKIEIKIDEEWDRAIRNLLRSPESREHGARNVIRNILYSVATHVAEQKTTAVQTIAWMKDLILDYERCYGEVKR